MTDENDSTGRSDYALLEGGLGETNLGILEVGPKRLRLRPTRNVCLEICESF